MTELLASIDAKLQASEDSFLAFLTVMHDIRRLPESLPTCSAADSEHERAAWAVHVEDLTWLLRRPVVSTKDDAQEFRRIVSAMRQQLESTRRLAGFDWDELASELESGGIRING